MTNEYWVGCVCSCPVLTNVIISVGINNMWSMCVYLEKKFKVHINYPSLLSFPFSNFRLTAGCVVFSFQFLVTVWSPASKFYCQNLFRTLYSLTRTILPHLQIARWLPWLPHWLSSPDILLGASSQLLAGWVLCHLPRISEPGHCFLLSAAELPVMRNILS